MSPLSALPSSPSPTMLSLVPLLWATPLAAFSPDSPLPLRRIGVTSGIAPVRSESSSLLASAASLDSLNDYNMRDLLFCPPEDGPSAVLVDAYANWCGPCKLIEPFLEKCAERYSDKLNVVKYDVEGENNKQLKVEMLLQGVMVRGLPTLVLYNDGKPLATHSGAITENELETWLQVNLFSQTPNARNGGMQFKSENKLKERSEESDSSSVEAKSERGFVSFASQFGRDEYAL